VKCRLPNAKGLRSGALISLLFIGVLLVAKDTCPAICRQPLWAEAPGLFDMSHLMIVPINVFLLWRVEKIVDILARG